MLNKSIEIALNALPSFENRLFKILHHRKFDYLIKNISSKPRVNINTVYDVGARFGNWSKTTSKLIPDAEFILFEATEKCTPQLDSKGFTYFIGALSSEEKTVQFYERGTAGDSYYMEKTKFYDDVAPKNVITKTLDGLNEQHNLPSPDFIKIDTQGSELDILEGGKQCLTSASICYLECPILEYNTGAPNIYDYISYMKNHDFIPIHIGEEHITHGALAQIDLLFLKKEIFQSINPDSSIDYFI